MSSGRFIFGERNGLVTRLHPRDGEQFVLPYDLRQRYMNDFHRRGGHFSVDKMLAMMRRTFWWPRMRDDIERYVEQCAVCRQVQAVAHDQVRVFDQGSILYALQPRSAWHVDYIGPLPATAEGFCYLVLFIDEYSGWVELFPVKDTSLEGFRPCLQAMIHQHGHMRLLRSDNGSPFNSNGLARDLQQLQIRFATIPPLAPQANGRAEAGVRSIKTIIKKDLTEFMERGVSWFDVYGQAKLAHNSAPHRGADNRFSPAELMNGQPLLNAAEQLNREDERIAVDGGRIGIDPEAGELNRIDFFVRRDAVRAAGERAVEAHREREARRKAQMIEGRRFGEYEVGDSVWLQRTNTGPTLQQAMVSSGNPQNPSAAWREKAEIVGKISKRTYLVKYWPMPQAGNENRRARERPDMVEAPVVKAKERQLRPRLEEGYRGHARV
jgi:hypothetical protein